MRRRSRKNWVKLDNAAKIFPPTTDKIDSKVFRFACELRETVDPVVLQEALGRTLEDFPGYRTVLKHGLFWYYLEDTELRPQVHEEDTPVCGPLYDKNEHSLLFDVSYYRRRISLEIYHALADGTGALQFLRALVCQYLVLAHPEEFGDNPPDSGFDASVSEKMADSFDKYYAPHKIKKVISPAAYKIKKSRLAENRLKVVEGVLPTDRTIALAKQHEATLTAFLAALLLCAIADGMPLRERKKPVVLSVPVNLRNYFASESTRNFFGLIYISYRFGAENDFEEVLAAVKRQMAEQLSPDSIRANMNSLIAMEKNALVRVVPLLVKDVVMNIGYRVSERSVTAALSNIGRVTMPAVFEDRIRLFDVMASTKKLQVCLCSYGNKLVISFTDGFAGADIQKYFFRRLASWGLDVQVTANPQEEGGEKQ